MSVSVCMATHNGARFLSEQLKSILTQLTAQDEIVISDDDSSDDTVKMIRNFDDPRVLLLPPKKFNNPSKNFEYALAHCKHDIIFLSDQDDVWHPNKITVMVDELQNFDLVVCDCSLVNDQMKIIAPSFFQLNGSKKGLAKNFYKNSFVGCCMGFHRKIFDKVVPFPVGIVLHDQWIGLVAQKHFKVKFIPQVLVDHRRHSRNYSTTGGTSNYSLGKKLISRLKLAKILLQR